MTRCVLMPPKYPRIVKKASLATDWLTNKLTEQQMDAIFMQKETALHQAMLDKFGENHPKPEFVILTKRVTKINKKGKEQSRKLLISNKALYNLKVNDMHSCQRRIDFTIIEFISISLKSNEFTIHIPTEYDYRYLSCEPSDTQAIIALLSRFCNVRIAQMYLSNMASITCTKAQSKTLSVEARRQKLVSLRGRQQFQIYLGANIGHKVEKSCNIYSKRLVRKYLKYVSKKDRLLVAGYIRRKTIKNYGFDIAPVIINYVVLFSCITMEAFESENNIAVVQQYEISDDHRTISHNKRLYAPMHRTIYGTNAVYCNDNNLNTFMWKFRINRIGENGKLFVGLHNSMNERISFVHCSETMSFAAGGCNNMFNVWKYGLNVGSMLHRYKKGDWLDLALDLVENKVFFLVNCDTLHECKNVVTKDQTYRLAVVLSNACIELKDFKIYNGSFKQYLKQRNTQYTCKEF